MDSVESTAASVTMNLAVDWTASEGAHTITVTTFRGVSNALPFTVRRGQPQIRDLRPTVVNPGRFYASRINFEGGDVVPQFTFGASGVDLTGVSSIQVSPPDAITVLAAIGSAGALQGVLMVGDSAQIGTRRLSVVTPGGRSNELAFEIRPPSLNAPVISNLTLNSTYVSGFRGSIDITYSGKFDFQDADGDLTSGPHIFLMVDSGSGSEYVTLVSDWGGGYFNQSGKTSGTIIFSFSASFVGLYSELTGNVPIICMVQDAAGNLSNALRTTVPRWDIPVL